jgi:preprotein translocase subunit YajC
MRLIYFGVIVVGASLAILTGPSSGAQQSAAATGQSSQGQAPRTRGAGGFPGGGRGILGTVTQTAADHYTIKTDTGDTYTVFYSANTRILKQGPGQGGGRRFSGAGGGSRDSSEDSAGNSGGGQGSRPQPQPIKPTDIKVGDIITAGGEVDADKKTVGAVFIAQIDPQRAKQMREMQANYGKTWLAGRITAIDGTRITIDGLVDHAPHIIAVDENTSFRRRRDSITLADIQPGQQLQAEGAMKDGAFLATTVTAQIRDQARNQNREAPAPASPNTAPANPQPK